MFATANPTRFRDVLSSFASGITVITAMNGETPHGFTCQAFTSLSLDPPMVAFTVRRESDTKPHILAAGRFCVNVLAADQRGHCHRFAARDTDRFEDIPWRLSPGGSPILDGVLAWIDCAIGAEYPGGDHTIVVGNVLDLASPRTGDPLVFYRGTFVD